MQLGSSDIAVPFIELGGDPTSFDPDWRAKVAELLSSGFPVKDLPQRLSDKRILEHAKFLKAFKSGEPLEKVFGKHPLNGLAMNWAAGGGKSKTKHYIEALLLTEQPLSVIAQDLKLQDEAVALYCDLYFACRSEADKYEMVLPMETRLSFAFGEISHDAKQLPTYVSWRVMAVRNGYSALVRHWGIEKFAHAELEDGNVAIDRNMGLVSTGIEQQLRSGQVGFRSLVEYMNAWQGYRKMQEGIEGRDGTDSPLYGLLGSIFAAVAPKLVTDKDAEKEKKAEAKAGKKKLLAEKNIGLHNSEEEKSKAVSAEFNKLKKEKFKLIDSTTGSKP